MENPYSTKARLVNACKWGGVLSWALVVGAPALFLTLGIVTFPFAVPLWLLAAMPMQKLVRSNIQKRIAWDKRDHAFEDPAADGGVPWVV